MSARGLWSLWNDILWVVWLFTIAHHIPLSFPLSVILHCVSFPIYCLSYTILCHFPLLNVIHHYLSYHLVLPIVYYSELLAISNCTVIQLIWITLQQWTCSIWPFDHNSHSPFFLISIWLSACPLSIISNSQYLIYNTHQGGSSKKR